MDVILKIIEDSPSFFDWRRNEGYAAVLPECIHFFNEMNTPVKTNTPPPTCHKVKVSPKKITAVITAITGIKLRKLDVSLAERCFKERLYSNKPIADEMAPR